MDADVVDVGFISDAREGAAEAERLRQADCDLIVLFLTTYLASSMVLPIAQRGNTPVLTTAPLTSRCPPANRLSRGLGVYHGKRGCGVSVEFDVQHGPVTLLGLGQDRDGT